MFTAVNNSNIYPITNSFDIKAFVERFFRNCHDVTDLINGDNEMLYLSSSAKSTAKVSSIQADKSYVVDVRSFPINIEVTAVKTYSRAPSLTGGASSVGNITMELNSSMVLLPKEPMQARYSDPRVGYFDVSYTDFDLNPQGVETVSMIKRWRLEPKAVDMEKYKRGELLEPKKPYNILY